jgi:DNA replication protein DnaC
MLRETILKEILKEYELLRTRSEKALLEREQIVLSKIPQLTELRKAYVDLMLQAFKENIQSAKSADNKAPISDETLADFKIREASLLCDYGFPEDYLSPEYRCKKCMDTGYTGWPVREKCSCLSQRLLEKLYELSDFGELERQNFVTFDPLVFPETQLEASKLNQREYMLQLKGILQRYAVSFPSNEKRTLLFSGKTGLGKTFLLNCMSKVILDKGYATIRMSAYNLSNRLFSSLFHSTEENQYLMSCLFDADLLIIDDLGTEIQRNNFTSEDLFNILNERLQKNRHTFLSTNLGLQELRERYSDRITSRLFDTTNTMIIKFLGQDVRLRHR